MIFKKTGMLAVAVICCSGAALHAQNGKQKDIHTVNKTVNRTGKDSMVTIIKEDRTNGKDQKQTLVIRDGDTLTNVVVAKNGGENDETGSSIVVNGDSVVRIKKIQDGKGANFQKKIIILNGDSVITMNPEDTKVSIDIDTAMIRRKAMSSSALDEAKNKGVVISDKFIIVNMDKLSHKDTTKEKLRNAVFKFGIEGFDLGFTQFVDKGHLGTQSENSLLNISPYQSVNVDFKVLDIRVNLVKHQLFLNAGLDFDLHDYGFANNVTIKNQSNKFTAFKDSTANFSRDKLATQYLELPVMLCFETNPLHHGDGFQIGVGGYAGMMLGSYTKQVSTNYGLQRYYGDLFCNPIDYGFMLEIGERKGVQAYFKYNASQLFDVSRGAPALASATVGIRFFHPFEW